MASHSCVSGEKCRFVFTLESKLEIPRAQVALVIRDRAGNLIVVVNSLDDGGAYMAIGRGVYEISIELSLPVKPGQYDMDICVKNEHWATLEQWVPDPSLIVMPRRDYSLPDEWRGLVDEGARFGCRAK
jgi:hypothetical protein